MLNEWRTSYVKYKYILHAVSSCHTQDILVTGFCIWVLIFTDFQENLCSTFCHQGYFKTKILVFSSILSCVWWFMCEEQYSSRILNTIYALLFYNCQQNVAGISRFLAWGMIWNVKYCNSRHVWEADAYIRFHPLCVKYYFNAKWAYSAKRGLLFVI